MNFDNAESVPESPEVNKRCVKGAANEMSYSGHNIDETALSTTGLSSDANPDQQLVEVTGEVKDNGENETVSETFPTTTPTTVDSRKQNEDISQPILPTIRVNTDATNSSVTVLADSSKPNVSTLQNDKDNESSTHLTDDPSCSTDDQTEAVSSPQEVLDAAARETSIQLTSTSSDSAVDTFTNSSSTSAECSGKLEQKADDMTYSKNWLGQFKKDYFHNGKFDLDIQVFHLARLAGFYMANYRRTNNWTDCVRAHALYNSISCRKPEFPDWKKHAFSVQEEFFGDSSSFSFEQQQKLTSSLKKDLEAIRDQSRDNMDTVHTLVHQYEIYDEKEKNNSTFFNKMKSVSIDCSDYMADFAAKIVRESVEILKPAEPPCDFEVVAIGSLARGEATPYSDLEYLFLVEDKSTETIDYFERLAITTYFQIANLGETKLGYMAIKELDGWFEDKAMNGFKIDGLSDKAGNLPTGNGSPGQRNHFIVTPEELGAKYQDVLNNPQKETALRGDITSMLTYLRLIYARSTNNKDLLGELQECIQNCTKNRTRQAINLEMLNTDIRKFNFVPNDELREKGYAADVKREIYRFPSILLLDIAVMTDTTAINSWESLIMLWNNKHISTQLKSVLELLLASAAYMRLSAYLFHDSQDDRMSVSQAILQSVHTKYPQFSKSQQRWFVPQGLFITMCVKLILLKEHLAKAKNLANSLQTLTLDDDDTWPRITTLYYSGRHREALVVLKQIYGDCLCEDPLSTVQKLPSGRSEYNILSYISAILYMCDEYSAALSLYKHRTDNTSDESEMIADCYWKSGDLDEALTVLERSSNKDDFLCYSLGQVYSTLKHYDKSEEAYLQALELRYAEISSEKKYDYYGNLIQTDGPTDSQKVSFTTSTSPEERLSRIINSTPNVIHCVTSLGDVYNNQGQYALAESYYKKTLYLISELYGEGAAVPVTAQTLYNLGNNYKVMGQYNEAVDSYKHSLAIKRKLSQSAYSRDIAEALNDLGNKYNDMAQYSEAEDSYKQALAIYRNLSQGESSTYIAHTLHNLGKSYNDTGQYSEAEDSLKQSLAIYRNLSQGADSSDIAYTLDCLGDNCMYSGQNKQAEEYLKDSLAMKIKLAQDITCIGVTLIHLTVNSRMMGQDNQADDYREQMAVVIRDLSDADLGCVLQRFVEHAGNALKDGQFIEAEECYKHCLIMSRRLSSGADSSDTADILQKLGETYRAAGDKDKAVETLQTFIQHGDQCMRDRQFIEAEELYRHCLIMSRRLSSGADSSDTADILQKLGDTYRAAGDESKAVESYREALDMYTALKLYLKMKCHS